MKKFKKISLILITAMTAVGLAACSTNSQSSSSSSNQVSSAKSTSSTSKKASSSKSTAKSTSDQTQSSKSASDTSTSGKSSAAASSQQASSSLSPVTYADTLGTQSAAILYYGATQLGNGSFNSVWQVAKGNSTFAYISQDAHKITTLQNYGNGVFYGLSAGAYNSDIGYTISSDGTVYFYVAGPSSEVQVGSASLTTIKNAALNSSDANTVNQLGQYADGNN
ncbi:hypothetical protein [Limosilactobacillus gastricus]|uniref:hypothetical protein n=1 Tax=Limosilactobacillus gastricus TaxID=227942 RepID=UPI0026EFB3C9|nr:hypothetical protein [Limosilactobacillus gastricus]